MNRTNILTVLGLCSAGVLPVTAGQATKQTRPNIVFIMSDDHAYQAISAYGHGLNQTPNIDRIASQGAIFNKGYCTNSICAPSRAVMLTGKFSHLNGKIDNRGAFDWNQQNFAKILQQNGYQTAMIGKIHLDGTPQGFDYWNVLPGQGQYYNPDFIENGVKKRFPGYVTTLTTEFALNWLDKGRDKSKPFCLLYHQKAPHRNWLPEEKYLDLYEDREFPFPETFFDDFQGRGTAAHKQEMGIVPIMTWGHDMKFENDPYTGEPTNFMGDINRMDEFQRAIWRKAYNPRNELFIRNKPEGKDLAKWKYQRYLRDYLKCIKSVDDGVGQMLDYLDQNGLTENTIVIYTSDQGFYLGEHGWFDKRFMYEESFRTPILMRFPMEIKPGTVVDQLVQNLDFAPTFLDYAGVEVPTDMQGMSFRKVVKGEKGKWRDAIYYQYYEYPAEHMVKRHYGVRTDRYKLIHFYYDVDEWEMYDLEKDPHEMKSIYGDPAYASVQKNLHKRLTELRAQYGDSDELDQKFIQEFTKKK
ncbi:MAG TPA: sulfatase [Prolixibacteraceae bacterium]|nr:sulfatase [Prolixibacteraceae bacterium]